MIIIRSIRVLDVTLRDGGCVIDFNFGLPYMKKILSALESSDVDCIELGYIDEKKGSESGRTQYINDLAVTKNFLITKKPGKKYFCMIDHGKFDVNNLKPRNENSIDGIRYCFHKKDCMNIADQCKKIIELGYEVYLQPMITLRYSNKELVDFLTMVNKDVPNASGVYIVDSFGEMRPNDVGRFISIVDETLDPKIPMGFHSHNNLQLSYSNAISFIQYPTNRDIMIDSSIMGMGKGAGNLNTELLLEHMNLFYGTSYKINPLLDVIDEVINQIHDEHYWGYAIEYYLSSVNKCTPSYAAHFYNKHKMSVSEVGQLLSQIREDKRISFDKEYAEALYKTFNESKYFDDTESVDNLKKILGSKEVLLIAPGKSIGDYQELINKQIKKMISISLNFSEIFDTDYVFISKTDPSPDWNDNSRNYIITSNVLRTVSNKHTIIDYKRWVYDDGQELNDSASVMALQLLIACGVKKAYLAGFDGFSSNINENYCNMLLRRPVLESQAKQRNERFSKFLMMISDKIEIEFITPTIYEN